MSIRHQMFRVVDFKSIATETIQLAYGTLMVLLSYPLMPKIIPRGTPEVLHHQ